VVKKKKKLGRRLNSLREKHSKHSKVNLFLQSLVSKLSSKVSSQSDFQVAVQANEKQMSYEEKSVNRENL